jgi:hypothetical protein
MAKLKIYDGSNWQTIGETPVNYSVNRTLNLSGNLRASYMNSAYVILLNMEHTTIYPNGITITSVYVNCDKADPTTELSAKVMYCDAQAGGAFPSTNPTQISVVNTTTGNFSQTGMTTSVASDKIVYLEMTADPTDYNTIWSLVINYTIN